MAISYTLLLICAVSFTFNVCENFDRNGVSQFIEEAETTVENPFYLNGTAEDDSFISGHQNMSSSGEVIHFRRRTTSPRPNIYGTTKKKGRGTTTTRGPKPYISTTTKKKGGGTTTTREPTKTTKTTKSRPTKTTPTKTTTKPNNRHWSKEIRTMRFGGLSGSILGTYLGYQIGKIRWEADMPAYSVQHYWHQDGTGPLVTTETEIENKKIYNCSSRAFFCLYNTTTMCLDNGKVYCLAEQKRLQPCTNSRVGACLPATLKLACQNYRDKQCNVLNWSYRDISIPCLKYMRVKYTTSSNKNDEKFKIPPVTDPANNICQCNKTVTTRKRLGQITCISLSINNLTHILCGGLNLSNYAPVSMKTGLNATNAKRMHCEPSQSSRNGNISNIFDSQMKSLLSRCEPIYYSNSMNMMCAHVRNLTKNRSLIPQNAVALEFECQSTLTSIFEDLKEVYVTRNINTICPCNMTNNVTHSGSGLVPNVAASINKRGEMFVSQNFCVYVAAFPTKFHTNKNYAKHLAEYEDERKVAQNQFHKVISSIANFLFY